MSCFKRITKPEIRSQSRFSDSTSLDKDKGLIPVGEILKSSKLLKEIKGQGLIQQRLIDGAAFRIEDPDGRGNGLTATCI